jgi:hypothetical protein
MKESIENKENLFRESSAVRTIDYDYEHEHEHDSDGALCPVLNACYARHFNDSRVCFSEADPEMMR